MNSHKTRLWRWLAGIVVAHLAIAVVHGMAHTEAQVALSTSASLFVYLVILAGPLIGLALTWPVEQIGYWTIGASLAGALVFGVVNHFVFISPDHVTHVDPQWRSLFTLTAVLLAATEACGSGLAFRLTRTERLS